MKDKKTKSSMVDLLSLTKSFLLGLLLTETFMIAKLLGERFVTLSEINEGFFLYLSGKDWILVIGISYFLTIPFYLARKGFWTRVRILAKSLRLDLLIILFWGSFLVYVFEGFKINIFKDWIAPLSWLQLTVLISFPIIIFVSILLRKLLTNLLPLIKRDKESLFMSDREVEKENDDKFDFYDKAKSFAERIFNQGSSESLIFGVEAPWGTGKSTFVNLCKEYWDKNYRNKMIIYTFDPLRYENKENLLEIFIDGLVKKIKDHVFAPEIESLVSKYAKLLENSETSFSFFGIDFSLPFGGKSTDDIFDKLEVALSKIDKKIVIIVDDLDRLNFSSIKEVLFVIKKAFTLPNISYVLCYDTENITALEQEVSDTEKISEFLEKFINVKIGLYLDNKLLLKYFTERKDLSLSKNLLANPELVSKAVEGLKDIFESKDFHHYLPFIGDARKLKRLINTILLLEVEKTDFENCDFNKQDLIYLLLVYINYPHIFRKIYNTETQGKNGFFSLVTGYEDGFPENKKSQHGDHGIILGQNWTRG